MADVGQGKSLVLLVADPNLQETYNEKLREIKKEGYVIMVGNCQEAGEKSKELSFSAHILYQDPTKQALEFANSIKDARGSAHPIVFVASPDLRGIVEEMGYKYIDGSDEDHINTVLDYMR